MIKMMNTDVETSHKAEIAMFNQRNAMFEQMIESATPATARVSVRHEVRESGEWLAVRTVGEATK